MPYQFKREPWLPEEATCMAPACQRVREKKEGHVLISMHTENSTERSRAKQILEQAGAEDIADTSAARV
jgi:hypothetical protein